MSRARKLINDYLGTMRSGRVEWARRTTFEALADGSIRRTVVRKDGTVEKTGVVSGTEWAALAARARSGLSQAEFAGLLGVSKRTLQEWEQGRKKPSGAALVLLRIAARRPEALKEAAGF